MVVSNWKGITPRLLLHTQSITFLPWSSPFRLSCRDPSFSNKSHERRILVTCYNILKKRIISLLWKQFWQFGYVISFFLITKSMRNQKDSLFTFPIFFEWQLIMRCHEWQLIMRRHEFKSWTRLIAFHIALIPLGKVWILLFSLQLWVNSGADWVLQPWLGD